MSKRRVFEVKARCLYIVTSTGLVCGTPTDGAALCDRHMAKRARLEQIMGEPPFKAPAPRAENEAAL